MLRRMRTRAKKYYVASDRARRKNVSRHILMLKTSEQDIWCKLAYTKMFASEYTTERLRREVRGEQSEPERKCMT